MSNSRKLLTWAGSIVAFFVVVFLIISLFSNSMTTVIHKQLDALRAGDVEKAYSYTSHDFKSATSLQEFRRFVDMYPLLSNNKNIVIGQTESNESNENMVKGTLYARNGANMPIQFILVQEDNDWRVMGIEVNPEDANDAANENKTEEVVESKKLDHSYDNQESRYTMKYPGSWEYEKSGDGTVIFSGKQGTAAYYSTVNIQTVLTKKSGGDFNTINEFMDDIKSQAKAQSPSVKFIENGSIDVPERDGTMDKGEYTVFTYQYKGKEFKQWQVVVLRHDSQVFYAWAYTSPVDQYDKYHDVAKSMLDSWVIY